MDSQTIFEEHLGIPQTGFLENVDDFMRKTENESVEQVLQRFDELHSKYKFMEYNLNSKKIRLKSQVPDIRSCLDSLRCVQINKDCEETVTTQFLLSDHLFAKAKIDPTDNVYLWLGANVMLEYTLSEAHKLLEKNLTSASTTLGLVDSDLTFLRDQMTTLEVNMARVYNWDVKKRQTGKAVKC